MNSFRVSRYIGVLVCVLSPGICALYAQPCIPPDARASIVVGDGTVASDTLWFGYAIGATCGIDSAICGEGIEPPPPPPPGICYPYWFSPSCQKHLWFDYVGYRGPTAVDTHLVRWDDCPGIFRWNPDSIRAICDSALFVDIFGGFFVRIRMDLDSDVVIVNPAVTAALIIRYGARPLLGLADGNETPVDFRLEQNYPNPFNPTTTIYYSVGRPGTVNVSVSNVLGERLATLADGYRDVGRYSLEWDASRMAGGVYFYRFVSGNFTATRKCILVK